MVPAERSLVTVSVVVCLRMDSCSEIIIIMLISASKGAIGNFFTISFLSLEPSPTYTLKWPKRGMVIGRGGGGRGRGGLREWKGRGRGDIRERKRGGGGGLIVCVCKERLKVCVYVG